MFKEISAECRALLRAASCLLITVAAEMLLWILVIVSMLAIDATPLPSTDSCCRRQVVKRLKKLQDIKWVVVFLYQQYLQVKIGPVEHKLHICVPVCVYLATQSEGLCVCTLHSHVCVQSSIYGLHMDGAMGKSNCSTSENRR